MTLDVGSKRIYDRDELTARADRIDELRRPISARQWRGGFGDGSDLR